MDFLYVFAIDSARKFYIMKSYSSFQKNVISVAVKPTLFLVWNGGIIPVPPGLSRDIHRAYGQFYFLDVGPRRRRLRGRKDYVKLQKA